MAEDDKRPASRLGDVEADAIGLDGAMLKLGHHASPDGPPVIYRARAANDEAVVQWKEPLDESHRHRTRSASKKSFGCEIVHTPRGRTVYF
jgi:hypothetical protein